MSGDECERFRPYGLRTTKALTLEGLDALARVVSIHDGDTLTAVVPFMGGYYKYSVRVKGVDTCELRSLAPRNRLLAVKARDRLGMLVYSGGQCAQDAGTLLEVTNDMLDRDVKLVRLACGPFDKYGRLLAEVLSPNPLSASVSYGEVLVAERLAYRYDGGKKLTEEEQIQALDPSLFLSREQV